MGRSDLKGPDIRCWSRDHKLGSFIGTLHVGRYAYGNQPPIARWNLARFAETLLPLLAKDKDAAVEEAQEAIEAFATVRPIARGR